MATPVQDVRLAGTVSAPKYSARYIAGGRARFLRDLELRAILGRARADGAEFSALNVAERLVATDRPRICSFVNAHAFNLAVRDERFRRDLLTSDHLFRDGVGMKIGMTLHRLEPGPNLNGTDLIPLMLQAARGRRACVFGTQQPWLGQGVEKIAALGLDVVATRDGFEPDPQSYVNAAIEARPDIVLLAMGMPKQEAVAHLIRRALDKPCLIINGGAIVDFIAGRVHRAPALARRLGMEWGWRLASEPRRLASRYLRGNPAFLARVTALRLADA